MGIIFVSLLADNAGQMQIARGEIDANFLLRLTAGATIRGFADPGIQLAATGTPQPLVGLLHAAHQKHLVALIETIEQGGNIVRE